MSIGWAKDSDVDTPSLDRGETFLNKCDGNEGTEVMVVGALVGAETWKTGTGPGLASLPCPPKPKERPKSNAASNRNSHLKDCNISPGDKVVGDSETGCVIQTSTVQY